jgi:hypothetical protein
MPITASEIQFFKSMNIAASSGAGAYGGSIGASELGGTLNEIFFAQSAEEYGGNPVYQYQKIFIKNADAAINFTSCKFWSASQEHYVQVTEGGTVTIPQVTFALEKASATGSAILDGTNAGSAPITLPPFISSGDFTAPASAGVGIAPPYDRIDATSAQGIWLRRQLVAGVVADASAEAKINTKGYST